MGIDKSTKNKELKIELTEFLETAADNYFPGVSIDAVIFSFHNEQLRVMLLRFGNIPYYSLPSSYIKKAEALDDAAQRILQERTGLKRVYLEQFYTAGNARRNLNKDALKALENFVGKLPAGNWFDQRFIAVCYYALVDESKIEIKKEPYVTEVKWFAVDDLPKLIFDHKQIIEKALIRLQMDLDQNHVGSVLLNGSFTMGELQKLYEAVHQRKLSRTAFQRKMLGLNILERLEKKYTGKAHKSPYLYRFKKQVIQAANIVK